MRTLKKTLCLVLCLAMMVGLCAVSASAAKKLEDYPDKADIKHEEAVAVMSALEVLQGDEGGFRPGDTLTRAEGAKIVTAILNVKPTGRSTFTDMASAEWAQPYVAYCEAAGILAGYGDGTFGPQDKLTGAAFAKMLLVALGYDATKEGLTGPTWEIGVAKLVNRTNLADKIDDFSYGEPITRDAAAQLGFNALLTPMVDYDGALTVDAAGNFTVKYKDIENRSYSFFMDADHNEAIFVDEDARATEGLELIENSFPKMKSYFADDKYGIPSRFWYNGDSRIDYKPTTGKQAAVGANALTDAIYTKMPTSAAVYKDAGLEAADDLLVYENGWPADVFEANKTKTTTFLPYAGATAYLIDGEIYVKYAYLAMVTKVTPATQTASKDREITMTVYNKAASTKNVVFATENFAVGDYVLVYPNEDIATTAAWVAADFNADDAIIDVLSGVETAAGKMTKVGIDKDKNANAFTIDSTKYSTAKAALAQMGISGNAVCIAGDDYKTSLDKDATVYLYNDYVLGIKSQAVPLADYVFVIGHTHVAGDEFGATAYNKVGYVKMDGTTASVNISELAATHEAYDGTADKAPKLGWYEPPTAAGARYTIGAPKTVNGELDNTTGAEALVMLNSAKPGAGGLKANDKTVYIVRNDKGAFNVYTGLSKAPSISVKAGKTLPIYGLNDVFGNTAAIFIDLYTDTTLAEVTSDESTVIYLLGAAGSEWKDGANTIYGYNAIVDGKVEEIGVVNNKDYAAGLKIPFVNAKGQYSKLDAAVGAKYFTAAKADITYKDGTLSAYYVDPDTNLGVTKVMAVNSNAVVYVYENRTLTTTTADQIADRYGDIGVIYTSGEVQKAATIYFVPKTK